MLGSRSWRALMRRNLIYRKRNWVTTILEFSLPILFVFFLVLIKLSTEDTDGFSAETVEAEYPSDSEVFITYSFSDYVQAIQGVRMCNLINVTDYELDISELAAIMQSDEYENVTSIEKAEAILSAQQNDGQVKFRQELEITGIRSNNNWQVPFVRCDSRHCIDDGEDAQPYCEYLALAVAPAGAGDDAGRAQAEAFRSYIYKRFPQMSVNAEDFGDIEGSGYQPLPFDFDFVQVFDSNDEIEDYVRGDDYATIEKPALALAVIFDGTQASIDYSYTIRNNSTGFNLPEEEASPVETTTPPTNKIFNTHAKSDDKSCELSGEAPGIGRNPDSCTAQYGYNGVLPIQRLIGDWIMVDSGAREAGYFVSEHGVRFAPFASLKRTENGFFDSIADFMPLLVTLGLLFPVATIIRYITLEKELRQKELMKMMSVTESDINWAWFVTFLTLHTITALGAAGMTKALFSNAAFGLLFIFWMFNMLAVITFSMFLAAFFSKSTRAALVGLLIFFIGYFLTEVTSFDDGNSGTIALVSLHPVAAFSYGLREIGRLEDLSVGLTSSTAGSSDNASGFTFNSSLASFVVDTILYGLLSWYFNRVVRSDFGQPLPWYFPFTASYWFPGRVARRSMPNNSDLNSVEYGAEVPIEPVSGALLSQTENGTSIEIRNLRKTFGKKIAVEGLNLSIFRDQVTALLGHNGAGKTTTINMLTGMFGPTSGCATIAGRDIRSDMANIRKDIGVVLQHDCLFPELTVKEHIEFFATVKGMYAKMSGSEAKEKIDQSIKDVALFEKRNTLSKNLSGGMKRKLHVAIAFCGDSKTVLLDEPTSGMDPFSRRFTWNVIRQYRQGRCIILTTHFMDEADVLGDRIAIMAEGRLRCLGSSLFLKKTYGVGYQLSIEKLSKNLKGKRNGDGDVFRADDNTNELQEAFVLRSGMEDSAIEVKAQNQAEGSALERHKNPENIDRNLKDIVMGAVPDATVLSNVGTELSFQLPLSESHAFTSLLQQLDEQVQMRNIVNYGLGVTTLEEVFLLVARGASADRDKPEYESSHFALNGSVEKPSVAQDDKSTSVAQDDKSIQSRMNLQNEGLFARHVGALVRKRAQYFKRDKKAWVCTTVLPCLFVLIGLILFEVIDSVSEMEALELDLDDYNDGIDSAPRNPILFNDAGGSFTCQPGNCLGDPIINVWSTGETYYACGIQSYLGGDAVCSIRESSNVMGGISGISGAQSIGTVASNSLEASYRIANKSSAYEATQYGAIFFTHDASSTIDGVGVGFGQLAAAACRSTSGNYSLQSECDNYSGGLGFVIRYNYTAIHAAPLFQSLGDQAIVRRATGRDDVRIKATIHPLPLTKTERGLGESFDAFAAWLLLILSFPFIAGSFGTFVVAERQSKAKHLQTVAGVDPFAYWFSTWLWDVANYAIPATITILLFLAFDVDPFITTNRGTIGGVIALLLLFGPAAASFTYCLSFMFTSPSICNLVIIISSFLIGMGGSLAAFILRLIGENPGDPNQNLTNAANIVEWVLRFVPSFNLSKGLFNAINVNTFEFLEGSDITVWHERILLYEVIFLAWQSVVYLFLAVKLDQWSSNPRAVSMWQSFVQFVTCRSSEKISGVATGELPDDDDVVAEQQRVLSGGANEDLIVLSELSKVYDNGKVAVNNVSLGIPPGQCFGLLGVNGAGKTTTMGMLTAEFPPTSGDATLAGFSVTRQPEKTRRRVGYCPQFDAHFENMTGREHVELYASIKGVPKESVKEAAALKLAEVGLSESDSDLLSGGYSGGMKRRLSLACATIGQPQIVFLDEASTGVDPVARREIWQMISDMVTGESLVPEERTSVILTTHSMEECEALCPNIGIMANGKLRCLGSAQHLKSKFGQGYQVEMKVKIVAKDDEDYVLNSAKIAQSLGVEPGSSVLEDVDSEEGVVGNPGTIAIAGSPAFLDFDQAQKALVLISGDRYLADIVSDTNLVGYATYREATSPTGISLNALATFATTELRLRQLHEFITESFPGDETVLRERQDTKVRFEIGSRDVRIAQVFERIEADKARLKVDEYGVSQTSLEQVFIQHATAAEKLKLGTVDG